MHISRQNDVNRANIASHAEMSRAEGLSIDAKISEALHQVQSIKQTFKTNLIGIAKQDFSLAKNLEKQPETKKSKYVAKQLESILPLELTDTDFNRSAGLFDYADHEIAYLGRTLTNRSSNAQPTKSVFSDNQESNMLQTLAIKEFNTLTNQTNYDILITPATLIQPNAPVELISSRPDRNEWFGLPSILYGVPKTNSGSSRLKPQSDSLDYNRPSFSHYQSFASNKAFGRNKDELDEFSAQQKERTPAENMKQLQENTLKRGLIKPLEKATKEKIERMPFSNHYLNQLSRDVPFESISDFSENLTNWASTVTDASGKESVHHNEVAIRLWPWDITHVSTASISKDLAEQYGSNVYAKSTQHALEVAATLAAKKYTLAEELLSTGEKKGINHPVFNDWLTHTYAFDPQSREPRTPYQLKNILDSITVEQKKIMLLDLASKLIEKISVVQYSPHQKGFSSPQGLENLPLETFNKLALLSGSLLVGLETTAINELSSKVDGIIVDKDIK